MKIPERMVNDALASAPARIVLHDRLGRPVMHLQEGRVFFGPGSDCLFTFDLETGEAQARDHQRM